MASEHANETQSPGPIAWLMVNRLHRPLQGQCRRDGGRFFLLKKNPDPWQAGSCVAQFEPPSCDAERCNPQQRFAVASSVTSGPRQSDGAQPDDVDLCVDCGCVRTPMPQQIANLAQGGSLFEHLGRQAVTEQVGASMGGFNSCSLKCPVHQRTDCDGVGETDQRRFAPDEYAATGTI